MMLKRQLMDLFRNYDEPIQEIILEVIRIEQENITEPNPRITTQIRRQIDEVVTRQAKAALSSTDAGATRA